MKWHPPLLAMLGLLLFGIFVQGATAAIYIAHGATEESLAAREPLPGSEWVFVLQNLTFWPAVFFVGWLGAKSRSPKKDTTEAVAE